VHLLFGQEGGITGRWRLASAKKEGEQKREAVGQRRWGTRPLRVKPSKNVTVGGVVGTFEM